MTIKVIVLGTYIGARYLVHYAGYISLPTPSPPPLSNCLMLGVSCWVSLLKHPPYISLPNPKQGLSSPNTQGIFPCQPPMLGVSCWVSLFQPPNFLSLGISSPTQAIIDMVETSFSSSYNITIIYYAPLGVEKCLYEGCEGGLERPNGM